MPTIRNKCEHGRERSKCIECGGAGICGHGRLRHWCKECGGAGYLRRICKGHGCDVLTNGPTGRYRGYCVQHFMRLFPEEPVARNYKVKEQHIVQYVKTTLPDVTWVCDKRYDFAPSDCASSRRPDMFCDFGTHIVIVEIDENQHKQYDTTCDNKRLCELYRDFQHRPIVFVRFNPDDYKRADGTNVTSCFGYGKDGMCRVKKNKGEEIVVRMNLLCDTIRRYSTSAVDHSVKSIEQVHLFFDGHP